MFKYIIKTENKGESDERNPKIRRDGFTPFALSIAPHYHSCLLSQYGIEKPRIERRQLGCAATISNSWRFSFKLPAHIIKLFYFSVRKSTIVNSYIIQFSFPRRNTVIVISYLGNLRKTVRRCSCLSNSIY